MLRFTEEDHRLVSEAVAKAEALSDAEIVTVVAEKSDSYHDVALHYAVLAMLLVPAALAAVPQPTVDRLMATLLGWNAELTRSLLMLLLFVALASLFLIVRVALAWAPLRMALTPGTTKSRRVGRRALQLFRVAAEKKTNGRTGVLLYLSLLEHRAEIVADEAIHSKVEPEVWGEAMTVLIEQVKAGRPGEGMALAVEKIGAVCAGCLAKTLGDPNQLGDRLIEI
ncbi:TPM domain-containing protein [Allosphingosinicella sp.]|jgi:putative membrane protein|uniref:TPM domain-containing protein n=1 Tax=Allosphingosinicella sp. TaxID=2823234 RepID=UPI002EE50D68